MTEQTHTITFYHIRSGQPRLYADSVYEFNAVKKTLMQFKKICDDYDFLKGL